jgi:SOS-response transcriptional repressor LexA
MRRAGDGSISAIYRVEDSTGLALPLFECRLAAGFPSPADEYFEERIDLNRDMILHPEATYYAVIGGDSMTDQGLWDGSIVAFDRALTAYDGDIVVACIDNSDFCCKIFRDGRDDHGRIRSSPKSRLARSTDSGSYASSGQRRPSPRRKSGF